MLSISCKYQWSLDEKRECQSRMIKVDYNLFCTSTWSFHVASCLVEGLSVVFIFENIIKIHCSLRDSNQEILSKDDLKLGTGEDFVVTEVLLNTCDTDILSCFSLITVCKVSGILHMYFFYRKVITLWWKQCFNSKRSHNGISH